MYESMGYNLFDSRLPQWLLNNCIHYLDRIGFGGGWSTPLLPFRCPQARSSPNAPFLSLASGYSCEEPLCQHQEQILATEDAAILNTLRHCPNQISWRSIVNLNPNMFKLEPLKMCREIRRGITRSGSERGAQPSCPSLISRAA